MILRPARCHNGSDMAAVLALLPLAYLAGAFPTAHLVARAGGHDVTREGSGNPGASNVYRLMGKGPAALVFAGDIAKGFLPALAGLLLAGHAGGYALGVAAVLGHVYPVTRRFRGGRGVATGAGMALAIYPVVFGILLVVFFAVSKLTHRASLASITVAVAFPVLVAARGEAGWEVAALSALGVLVLARHSANLRRLVHGEELRLDDERGPGRGHERGAA